MPVHLRRITTALLMITVGACLAACLPVDPNEVRHLRDAEDAVRAMPGVTGAHSSTSNGLDAGEISSFTMGVATTATPEEIESAIEAARDGLRETLVADKGFTICVTDDWDSDGCGSPTPRIQIRYQPTVDPDGMRAALETVQRVSAATEVPFDVSLGANPAIFMTVPSADHGAIGALATAAGAAVGDADFSIHVTHHGDRGGQDTTLEVSPGSLAPRVVAWWGPLGKIVAKNDAGAWLTMEANADTWQAHVWVAEDGSVPGLAADLAKRATSLAQTEETVTITVTRLGFDRDSVTYEIARGDVTSCSTNLADACP